jgi:hypothetical protein
METIAFIVVGAFLFLVGVLCGCLAAYRPDPIMDYSLEIERRRRQEAETKLYAFEQSYSTCGKHYPYNPVRACEYIEKENVYKRGFYDGQHSVLDDRFRMKSVKETEDMHAALTKAMKPLEKLKADLDV